MDRVGQQQRGVETAARELGAKRSPARRRRRSSPAPAARSCRRSPGTSAKQRRDRGARRHRDRRAGRGAAHVGDRRQRHDGVAQPVGREDDQTLHRVLRSKGPMTRLDAPHRRRCTRHDHDEDRAAANQSDRRRSRRQRAPDSRRAARGRVGGADLAVTPELALVGYLPRDLLLNAGFVRRSWDVARAARARRRRRCRRCSSACRSRTRRTKGGPLFNSAVLLRGGRVEQRFRKALLPTYDVFDEDRYFEPFHGAQVLDIGGRRARHQHLRGHLERSRLLEAAPLPPRSDRGARRAPARRRRQPVGVAVHRRQAPAARGDARAAWRASTACRSPTSISSAATTISSSTAAAARSTRTARRSRAAARSTPTSSSAISTTARPIAPAADLGVESEIWRALVLGTRDYARKCGFTTVVLGLSGGIDSALTAAIAAEALGADQRARRADAVALFEPGQPRRCARAGARTSASRR